MSQIAFESGELHAHGLRERVGRALSTAVTAALEQRRPDGAWEGVADPRVFDTAVVAFALARAGGSDAVVRRARDWLGTARPQEHPAGAGVVEERLRLLALEPDGVAPVPLEAFGGRFSGRTVMLGALAVAAELPGATAHAVFEAAAAGLTGPGGAGRLKQWQQALLASAELIASTALGLPANPRSVQVLCNVQDRDGSLCSMPAVTAVACLALTLSNGCQEAGQRALTHLHRTQHPDGTWRFVTTETWDTALMVRSLRHLPDFDRHALQPALEFLAKAQSIDGGWGIRPGIESDNDTTAMTLLALAGTRHDRTTLRQATDYLQRVQQPSGLWTTWQSADDAPSQDVTAHVISGLTACPNHCVDTEAARRWLTARYQEDGAWHADWYAPPAYAVAEISTTLSPNHPASQAAAARLLDQQLHDGGWPDHDGGQTSSAAATGLALTALAHIGAPVPGAIASAVTYLIETQHDDGTWPGTPIMYGPRPFLAHIPTQSHAFAIAGLRDSIHSNG